MTRFTPANIDELHEAVSVALAAQEPLEIVAGGSKRGLGRPLQTPHALDLTRLAGIRDYAPSELVLTAGAATPLDEIAAALAVNRQMLAFEPPDWRRLLGADEARPTLGGVLACNLSGPRRPLAGAARDHFLGFRGVNGRGEIFKAGGRVVKNVTGYDLPKLMAGSYGTLAALEEVTVKVLPPPDTVCTLLLCGRDPAAAALCFTAALGAPHEVSGAAYLPAGAAIPEGAPNRLGIAALRLEGPEPSVAFRREALLRELAGGGGEAATLDEPASIGFWQAIRDVRPLIDAPGGFDGRAIWRLSVAPSRGAALGAALARDLDAVWYLDWGGGLIWLAVVERQDGGAVAIRAAMRGKDGTSTGHATLVRGSAALRGAVSVFEPQPAPLAALSRRVKESFDPCHILNPGRMVEGC